MFRTIRTVIIGLLLGIALILAIVNFNSVKERITDLFDGFNQLPESFSLGDIFEGFENTDTSIINNDGYIVKVLEGYSSVSYYHVKDNASNLTEVCSETIACINAGFFLDDGTHAGLLTIDGRRIVSLAPNDKQLTHVVRYQDGFLNFIPNSDYAFSSSSDFEFQSGPLFLENGNIRGDLINASSNGNLLTFRSFIGIAEDGKIFIGVTTRQVDLETLGNRLKRLLGENITAINLDGGSSVAVYFRDSSLNSFGTSKILPNFIMFGE